MNFCGQPEQFNLYELKKIQGISRGLCKSDSGIASELEFDVIDGFFLFPVKETWSFWSMDENRQQIDLITCTIHCLDRGHIG